MKMKMSADLVNQLMNEWSGVRIPHFNPFLSLFSSFSLAFCVPVSSSFKIGY